MFVSYLWGIETLHCQYTFLTLPQFVSYLWGIETTFDWIKFLFFVSFVSYLWGIETEFMIQMGIPGLGLYLTYEGLKQNCRTMIPRSCTSLYLTYEGLKLSFASKKIQLSRVCILPMRDWNQARNVRYAFHLQVCILPMRDWNWIVEI